jgi:hypothetical protein
MKFVKQRGGAKTPISDTVRFRTEEADAEQKSSLSKRAKPLVSHRLALRPGW